MDISQDFQESADFVLFSHELVKYSFVKPINTYADGIEATVRTCSPAISCFGFKLTTVMTNILLHSNFSRCY